jgi:mono/diheme cytochrome c family protein
MRQHIKHHSISVAIVLAIFVAGAGVFIYSGVYNLGADVHHSAPMLALMQTLRDRSIHAHSKDIKVPDLDDPQLILNGAGHYAAMCTGCHLAPDMKDSEIRPGLYPEPPNLSQVRVEPQDAFWVIKHGIKMSAMPAWGLSHDDPTIWSMVAFLHKLPDMTRAQYKDIVAKVPPDEDMDMDEGAEHVHDGRGPDTHDSAKGTDASEEARAEGSSQGAAGDKHHPH